MCPLPITALYQKVISKMSGELFLMSGEYFIGSKEPKSEEDGEKEISHFFPPSRYYITLLPTAIHCYPHPHPSHKEKTRTFVRVFSL